MDGEEAVMEAAPGEGRWPFMLHVQVKLLIPTLQLAPHWGVLELPITTVQQRSYAEITADTYRKAWQAIVERTQPDGM